MLTENDKAPEIDLSDQDGRRQRLSDFSGRFVVVYFYPKDNTPGCTKEACNFRDNFQQLTEKGVVILGISKDTAESHQKFAGKYHLPFPLLSDPELKVIKAYGAWGKKKFMGREFEGTKRISYLINPKGMIAKKYEKVNPITHANEVMEDLKRLLI